MLSDNIKTLFSETDKLDELNAIIDECKELEITIESATSKISELETTIADLRDTNMKLFLQVQGEATTEETQEEDTKTVDDIFDEILGE